MNPKSYLKYRTLGYKNSTAFFGLVLDYKLTWEPHILRLKSNLGDQINFLKVLKISDSSLKKSFYFKSIV